VRRLQTAKTILYIYAALLLGLAVWLDTTSAGATVLAWVHRVPVITGSVPARLATVAAVTVVAGRRTAGGAAGDARVRPVGPAEVLAVLVGNDRGELRAVVVFHQRKPTLGLR
jgi:hypothetical protein